MKSVSRIALGVALALGGAAPALAQQAFSLAKQERQAIAPLQQAVNAQNWAAAAAALPAARAAASGGQAKYIVAALQLRTALGTQNQQAQAEAIDAMIASGGAPQADLPQLYRNQAAVAANLNAPRKAEAALTRWLELTPNDAEGLVMLAEVKSTLNKPTEAAALLDRGIELRRAAGQPVPESWYKRGLKHSFDARLAPLTHKFNRDLLAAYPSAENWRDALLMYRELGATDPVANLDALRLMRAAKALHGERDFYEMANMLNTGGMAGEADAVLDEAIAAKMVDPTKATFKELVTAASRKAALDRAKLGGLEKAATAAATGTSALSAGDAFLGYGEYAKAAAMYRAAVQKGSVDASLANTRLGMALALAGQRAEAEAAFRSVTGPRAELASLWLLWLAQRG